MPFFFYNLLCGRGRIAAEKNLRRGEHVRMRTAVVYYTFGGATKKQAERIAAEQEADLFRVREAKDRSLFGAFIPGAMQARNGKKTKILPLSSDLRDYERIILGGPVWASFPAPAFYAMIDLLPPGKEVEVFLCAGREGERKCSARIARLIEARQCSVKRIVTIPTGIAPSKLKET